MERYCFILEEDGDENNNRLRTRITKSIVLLADTIC